MALRKNSVPPPKKIFFFHSHFWSGTSGTFASDSQELVRQPSWIYPLSRGVVSLVATFRDHVCVRDILDCHRRSPWWRLGGCTRIRRPPSRGQGITYKKDATYWQEVARPSGAKCLQRWWRRQWFDGRECRRIVHFRVNFTFRTTSRRAKCEMDKEMYITNLEGDWWAGMLGMYTSMSISHFARHVVLWNVKWTWTCTSRPWEVTDGEMWGISLMSGCRASWVSPSHLLGACFTIVCSR